MKEGIVNLKEPCGQCGSQDTGEITQQGTQYKLTCCQCFKYIKWVKKTETFQYVIPLEDEFTPANIAYINFKLDLIIDHLGIKA